MKLVEVQIETFRNIVDSNPVGVEPDVTCLVGKNESGKTAFLHALHRLMPEQANVSFSVPDHYPAWREKRDRQSGKDLEEARPVRAVFELSDADLQRVEEQFGPGTLGGRRLKLWRRYGGDLNYNLNQRVNERRFVEHVVDQIDFPHGTKTQANETKKIEGLRTYAKELREKKEDEDHVQLADDLESEIQKRLNGDDLPSAVWAFVKPMVPRFLYFSEYSRLPYSVDIKRVLTTAASQLKDEELTARALLRLGGADDDYLTDPDYERRKRELENVSNALTQDVRRYWTQNPDLRVQPDITQKTVTANHPNRGQQAVVDELKLRIYDNRHLLSLPFNEHSTGFRWFFSFLAAFSKYEHTEEPLVILLDEPALGLHAKAQADFLRYIEERLAPRCQVIYTTHSPFMVQPGKLERVRLVEDKTSRDDAELKGATVSSDVTSTDADTLFPLQGALGYDLVQHLFIGPNNLVVEGTSDYTYLRVLSDHLARLGDNRTALDERWSIIPVGGADLVPTFVALLGNHLDVTVLVDAQKKGHQKLSHLAGAGILQKKRILTVGGVLEREEADIEDLFTEEDYVKLYNRTFGKSLSPDDLNGEDPIARRLARREGKKRFDHGRPADELLRHRDEILPELSEETLQQFEALFATVNATMAE